MEIKKKGMILIKEKMPDIIKSIDEVQKDESLFTEIDISQPVITNDLL